MILTVTPNPALDVTHTLDHLDLGGSQSVTRVTARPGGKGVNVATTAVSMGRAAGATGPVGADQFTWFAERVRAEGVSDLFVAAPGALRRSIAIITPSETTVLNEAGECPPRQVWDAVNEVVRQRLGAGDVLAVSGSLPPGTPDRLVADLVTIAAGAGASSVIDVRGQPLTLALPARPTIVTPNQSEAAQTTGLDDPLGAARALVEGGAKAAVVSCGADGLFIATTSFALRARLPEPLAGNPTGAGDALSAALCVRLESRESSGAADDERAWWRETARQASAWAAAAVLQPTAGVIDPAHVAALSPIVLIKEIS